MKYKSKDRHDGDVRFETGSGNMAVKKSKNMTPASATVFHSHCCN